jgi:hypothetical protein
MRMNQAMRRFLGLLTVTALASLTIGCATAKAPSVTLTDMTVSFDEPDGAVLWFELTIVNSDIVDLPLAEARYSVSVDGETVFRGVRSAEATVPSKGVATVRLPASAPNGSGIEPGQAVSIQGRITYLTPSRLSEVLFDADVFRPEKVFTATATIPGPSD